MSLRLMFVTAILIFASWVAAASPALTQSGARPRPAPTPPAQEQDPVEKIYVEEVLLPVFAYEANGTQAPWLDPEDVLVLEDDVPQEVRSVRRVPASVLLLLDVGGDLNPAVRSSTTRDIALNLLSELRPGDRIALMQFNSRPALLQGWTSDKDAVALALRTKLSSGSGSLLSRALSRAAEQFEGEPHGNRHVVLISDGVEAPGRLSGDEAVKVLSSESAESKAQAAEARRKLVAAQAVVHVISYAEMTRQLRKGEEVRRRSDPGVRPGSVEASGISRAGIDPTLPPGVSRGGIGGGPTAGVTITFDPAMRRLRKAHEQALKRGGERLRTLAEETGGRLLLPENEAGMILTGGEVAREVDGQYVVTYAPKRRLATSPADEYRRVHVGARRIGLELRSRRGYVVGAMREK